MAKIKQNTVSAYEPVFKLTSIGHGRRKTSSMNKHKRRSWKKYRGQGR